MLENYVDNVMCHTVRIKTMPNVGPMLHISVEVPNDWDDEEFIDTMVMSQLKDEVVDYEFE